VSSEAASAPRHGRLGLELALVVTVALAVLAPGIGGYSLVDPWETHYGEVGRMMRQTHDYVYMQWPGTNADAVINEGFRSKPVLTPWLIAAGMHSVGLAADGGYSGEMVHDARTMIGLRLPFVLCAIAGLTMLWWMLARLVSRRLAWLALLVVGSSPMFCLVARQAIPDMPLAASVIGAIALLVLAIEDGDRPCAPLGRIAGRAVDARHVVLALAGGFVVVQASYYAYYFLVSPQLAVRGVAVSPAIWLPVVMLLWLGGLSCRGWLIVRLPFVLLGGLVAAIVGAPAGSNGAGGFGVLARWERHAPDRYVVRAAVYPIVCGSGRGGWAATLAISDRLLHMAPLATMRQVYLLGCYALLGVSVLAKGPPGLVIAGGVGLFHVVLQARWRALYDGAFELKRGILLLVATCLPWHIAMFLKDGITFINQYLFFHILDRAGVGVDNSPGTFEMYTSQLGAGMWLWAALVPAALAAALLRTRTDTRAGRVRFLVAIWAMVTVAVFGLVQTKFHHYILPAVAPLGVLVACFLDDVLARRDRLHPIYAALGVAIVLLICRDLMHEPERWIEMFVYLYNRPWPAAEPWQIDPSDGFLALGAIAALGLAILATRWRRLGAGVLGLAGAASAIWSLQVYMPIAGEHWGMRDAMRAYYDQRAIYGEKLVYFGLGELYDDWHAATDRRSFQTHVPEALQVGQPMTVTIQVHPARDERTIEHEVVLVGQVTAVGDHVVELALVPGERAKLAPLLAGASTGPRGRPPIRVVDADRILAWQLYWRGENFWSTEEIWGPLPEEKATFLKPNNVEFLKYLNDRSRAPLGRRYFVIADASRITSVRSVLPTQRARDSFEVVDTTSNKFSVAAFVL
jgi:4-amino-4-deoxy-L-arabinose transferase-like glycosyltransferase